MKNNLTIQTKNSFRKHLMTKIIVINISTETRKTNTKENQKRILTLILDNYNAPSPQQSPQNPNWRTQKQESIRKLPIKRSKNRLDRYGNRNKMCYMPQHKSLDSKLPRQRKQKYICSK